MLHYAECRATVMIHSSLSRFSRANYLSTHYLLTIRFTAGEFNHICGFVKNVGMILNDISGKALSIRDMCT